jgi:hypothetical protein
MAPYASTKKVSFALVSFSGWQRSSLQITEILTPDQKNSGFSKQIIKAAHAPATILICAKNNNS